MPKINQNAQEESTGKMTDHIESTLNQVSITTNPVLVIGVNRKLNCGNYETLDIYAGITLPLNASLDDKEELRRIVEDVAEYGFGLVSTETGSRYTALKDMQKQGRK